MLFPLLAFAALAVQAAAHYTFPNLVVGGVKTPDWVNVRKTNNYNTQAPVTDVKSADFRCYNIETHSTASTINVAAGSQLGMQPEPPSGTDVANWDGAGSVWFKVYEISAVTNGGQSISFPAQSVPGVTFTVPKNLPSGQYLVRIEAIALHVAQTYGGAQFYISCGQINVTGGGSGTPAPLVAIPGVYTGNEPGILLNINWPIPTNYTQPGPPVWQG